MLRKGFCIVRVLVRRSIVRAPFLGAKKAAGFFRGVFYSETLVAGQLTWRLEFFEMRVHPQRVGTVFFLPIWKSNYYLTFTMKHATS